MHMFMITDTEMHCVHIFIFKVCTYTATKQSSMSRVHFIQKVFQVNIETDSKADIHSDTLLATQLKKFGMCLSKICVCLFKQHQHYVNAEKYNYCKAT